MKKKILAMALAVALVAIMVGGSLAYFTAEDEVTNTFTVGMVDIEIWENDKVTDTDVVEFEEPMLPVVNMDDLVNDPGYFAKVVKVENTGENIAFIRTHIAVPTALVGYLELNVFTSDTAWTYVGSSTATVDNVAYTVFTYDHIASVDPDAFTAELLKGVYLHPTVDIKDNPDTASADLEFCKRNADGTYTFSGFVAHSKVDGGYTSSILNILVASEAIQAQGFEDSGATAALNAGFGANTNPWAE